MMNAEKVQQLLVEHIPADKTPEDDTVIDYIAGMLADEDAYDDPEALISTIESLVVGGESDTSDGDEQDWAKNLVQALAEERSQQWQHQRCSPIKDHTFVENAYQAPVVHNDNSPLSSDSSDSCDAPVQSKAAKRKESRRRRKQKQPGGEDTSAEKKVGDNDAEYLEDDASAWKECQEQGSDWGGRGKGGRGAYVGANSIRGNIHLDNVTIALSDGTELLDNATIDITKGHRYGAIGRNGCGKSQTLMRLAGKTIPGMPRNLKILLVRQQIEGSDTQTALEALVEADTERTALLRQQEELELRLESDGVGGEEVAGIVECLERVALDLDAISSDTAEERALEILQGLQFTSEMIHNPTQILSGGWRMRLSLAQALYVPSDLVLFDECTNHLDLHAVGWLVSYLTEKADKTLIVVSHDRAFLDAICTDIIVMAHQKLKYHVGNYSEYRRQEDEKAARETQILDAAERQKAKAQAFVEKQQQQASKKSADPNKQRQAKMIKTKKMDRIGNYRDDGKRYKLNSLKQLDMRSARLAQKVVIEADDPVIKMRFPDPVWPPSIGPHDPIVKFEDFSFGYNPSGTDPILNEVTLSLNRDSKVACVGKNASGKSTIAKLIAGDIDRKAHCCRGELWIHPSLNVGHVTQYSVEELEAYADQTVVEYTEKMLRGGKAAAEIVAKASGNVRQYLGSYGLGGRHANQKIGTLSGGERMRLCFATVLADRPGLLLLDESTNHCDLETLDSMSEALNAYKGAVFMVSHNQGFLSGFCKELWAVEKGHVAVTHSDTETFDEIFSEYRASVLKTGPSRTRQRQQKTDMAKRAVKQRAGARQNTGFV